MAAPKPPIGQIGPAIDTATSAISSAIPSSADIGAFIREQRQNAKLSLRRLAADAGVSNPYLSQVERGLRKPSAEILQQLAKGLRISAEQLYVQAGLLEDRGTSQHVEAAILSDPAITERQKRALLDIYASFVTETRAAASDRSDASTDGVAETKKPRKKSSKQPVKKATRKTAAKSTTAKKPNRKTVKKTVKKTGTQTARTPAQKTTSKTAKKSSKTRSTRSSRTTSSQ
jgi:transcriptional regulator with XRE-family HTH domain